MGGGFGVCSDFCTSAGFVLKSHIFVNISKWLLLDNEGVLFTHCFVQNLHSPEQLLPFLVPHYLSLLCPFRPSLPSGVL